jgi:predicted transcriptional regulator
MLDADDELAYISGERAMSVLDEDALHEPVSVLCRRKAETITEAASIADAVRRMKTSRIGRSPSSRRRATSSASSRSATCSSR